MTSLTLSVEPIAQSIEISDNDLVVSQVGWADFCPRVTEPAIFQRVGNALPTLQNAISNLKVIDASHPT